MEITLNIYAPDEDRVFVCFSGSEEMPKKISMEQAGDIFSVSLNMPENACILNYYFYAERDGCVVFYGNNPDAAGGEGREYSFEPVKYQITVYKEAEVPKWYKDSVVYQIFPDRFARGSDFDPERVGILPDIRGGVERCVEEDWNKAPVNEFDENGEIKRWRFYGGSLDGIREKLSYLEGLGVTAIYLNPIFRARSTHRYDTSDYGVIDPSLGDEKAFKRLAKEAREHGIRLILDGVFNHCGADSIYFDYYGQFFNENGIKGAYNNKDSKYRKWFTFQKGKQEYRCWWNIPDLPDFDTGNKEYIDYITSEKGILKKWLRLGASGWRLDVADELPNPFLKAIRASIKSEDPDALLIGEVWDDPTNKYSYGQLMEYFLGDELDATMNYPFRACVLPFVTGIGSAYDFCRAFMHMAENYPKENFYGSLNLLGSHDRERVLNILGGYPIAKYGFDHEISYYDLNEEQYSLAVKRYKMLSILQFCLPGVPDIYYGDEAGLQGGSDPDCRRAYPWGHEDEDLVAHFKWLGKFYHEHSCLKEGGFKLNAINDDVLALERFNAHEKILIIINRSDQFTNIEYKGKAYELWPFDGKIII